MPLRRRLLAALALAALLALLHAAYAPGLAGPFLFDDYANLDVLGSYGRLHDLPGLLFYLTSGIADPTGRPLALLSFLLDARDWPADPAPFKRTNLLLHLLNTALLFAVAWRLQLAQGRREAAEARPARPLGIALAAAALWAAHPFLVSTTLYVVQREAMLPMAFVLLGLLAWARAAADFSRGRTMAGWWWALPVFALATLLGGLSKANGLLAPLLAGLAYLWFLRPAPVHRAQADRAAALCLGLPSAVIVGYLCWQGVQLWSSPLPARDWTLPERLLSEPRALWAYVGRLALPRAGGGGLYVDSFQASRGLLSPWTTLPALLALAASIWLAIAARRRFPRASFAWLFFLAAHLLESTTIPLELYFEHRNYLPAMFLGWPIAHALLAKGPYPRYRAALLLLLVSALLLLTNQRARVWGDAALFDTLSAIYEQDSSRAKVRAAHREIAEGDARGLERLQAAQVEYGQSVDIAIAMIGAECTATGRLSRATDLRAQRTLRTSRQWNYRIYEWMQRAAREPALLACAGFGLPGLERLVGAAEENPQNAPARRKRDLWHVRGRIALATNRPAAALRWFDAALTLDPDPEYALVQAAALGDAGQQALGVRHLDFYGRLNARRARAPIRDMAGLHQWLLDRYGYHERELRLLRQALQDDADSGATQASRP